MLGRAVLLNWLKENVYIATWLALPVTLLVGVCQARKTEYKTVNWLRLLMYFSFVTSLAVAFTPRFDADARNFAHYLIARVLPVIVMTAKLE